MIGLDTNVLVRFLVQDDPVQTRQARAMMAGLTADAPGFICREVMVELVWVLERAYCLSRADIATAVERLLEATEVQVETANRVGLAISRYRAGGPGFADQMILLAAAAEGCSTLASFDRAIAASPGGSLPGALA